MNKTFFKDVALADLQYLKRSSPKSVERIKKIINYIENNNPPYSAYHAKHFTKMQEYPDCWSMHVSAKHRIIFKFENDKIMILRCCGHYNDR